MFAMLWCSEPTAFAICDGNQMDDEGFRAPTRDELGMTLEKGAPYSIQHFNV
jgi:hypothetical protein